MASSYFKTKRVDSKYEKFADMGAAVSKEYEKLFQNVQTAINLNREELTLNSSLHQETIGLSKNPTAKQFFTKWDMVLEVSTQELQKIFDELYDRLLDLRVYSLIIERRYQLKDQNAIGEVEQLERTFEAEKDAFLEELDKQLKEQHDKFTNVMSEQVSRLKASQ